MATRAAAMLAASIIFSSIDIARNLPYLILEIFLEYF